MATATAAAPAAKEFKGNDSALLGIVLAVVTFWLFAQTTMNIGPLMAGDVGMPMPVMIFAPRASASRRNAGITGLNTTSQTTMPGRMSS